VLKGSFHKGSRQNTKSEDGRIFRVNMSIEKTAKEQITDFYVQKKDTELNILVVDDSRVNLTVASSHLARHYMKADTCSNGKEALVAVRSKHYDLVFMDQMMPEMSGLEAASLIRELGISGGAACKWLASVPIIALTANTADDAKEEILAAGMNDFLSKPLDPARFNSILAKYLPADKIIKRASLVNPNELARHETNWSAEQHHLYRELSLIKNLDVKKGLVYLANSVDDYFKVLRQFCRGLDDLNRVITEDIANADWGDYAIRLHAYRGTLAIMGHTTLSDWAKKLESASKNGTDGDIKFCKIETKEFLSSLADFRSELLKTSLFNESKKGKAESVLGTQHKLRELSQACTELKADDAELIVAELQGITLDAELDKKIEEICLLVSSYRFLEAAKRIDALIPS
jgi:CheY-like chemotaxis protein